MTTPMWLCRCEQNKADETNNPSGPSPTPARRAFFCLFKVPVFSCSANSREIVVAPERKKTMIEPNKVTEAVMEFMDNPTWKGIFMNAPGGAMERLAISFYFSKFHDQFKPEDFQEYRDLRDEYEKSLTEEDLNYLIENSDKENAKKHYQELLAKLQQSGGQPQGNMRFEKEGAGEEQQSQAAEGAEQSSSEEKPEAKPEETTEKVEETVQQGEDGQEKVEEKSTETVEEKPADGNQSPA